MTKIGILLQKNCHKCYNGKKYGGELCYIWGGELLLSVENTGLLSEILNNLLICCSTTYKNTVML